MSLKIPLEELLERKKLRNRKKMFKTALKKYKSAEGDRERQILFDRMAYAIESTQRHALILGRMPKKIGKSKKTNHPKMQAQRAIERSLEFQKIMENL